MLPIYVYSNGATAADVFNGVAAFLNGGGYPILITIASMIALLASCFQYVQTKNLKVMAKWFAIYFGITAALLGIKVSIQVIDLTNPMSTQGQVDHVPWGLAMPASIITTVESAVSQSLADVFHIVDDEDYNKTGMMFGSQIYHTVLNASTSLDSSTREALTDFVGRCVIPDIIVNHKYTFDQIKNSSNIFDFLSNQKMSPLRGIYYNGEFATCAAVLPQLKSAVSNNTTEQFALVGQLLGHKPSDNFNAQEHITNSFQYLIGISEDAKNILMQNVAINALRNGVSTSMAASNASSALLNLSTTTAMHKQLLTDFASGKQASYMMPLIQTALMLLLFSLFPIVILIALIPNFTNFIIKTYILSMIYLALWPICFTVINFIMSSALSDHLSALAIAHGGITLSNQDASLYEIEQFAGYASFLINCTPLLAGGLLFGLHRMFMSASQVMLGSMQGQITQTASQMSQGDFSFANTSVGNHNWNNWGANKHDLNATNYSGSSSFQLADGATKTITQDGHTVMNASGAISQLPVGLNFASSLASSYQSSHDHAEQSAMSAQKSFHSAVSSATNAMHQYSVATAHNQSYGNGASMSTSTGFDRAMTNMNKLAQEASHSLGISESEAARGLTSLSVDAHASWNSGDEVLGKIAKWASGANAGVAGRVDGQSISSHEHGASDSTNQSSSMSRLAEFRSNLQEAQNFAQNHHMDIGHSKTASLAKQFSSSLNDAQTASHNYSVDKTESARYSQLASMAKQESVGLNENLSQRFVAYVQEHAVSKSSADAILSDSNSATVNSLRQEMAHGFLKQYENNATQWVKGNQPIGMNAITRAGNSSVTQQSSSLTDNFQSASTAIDKMGGSTSFNNSQMSAIKKGVQSVQDGSQGTLSRQENNISQAVDSGRSTAGDAISAGKERASEGAIHNVGSSTVESFNNPMTSFIENHEGLKKF